MGKGKTMYCGRVYAAARYECLRLDREPTDRNVAELLGVNIHTVMRWRLGRISTVRPSIADRAERETGRHISWFERAAS